MRRAAQMKKSAGPLGRPPSLRLPPAGVHSSYGDGGDAGRCGGALAPRRVRFGLVRRSPGAFEQRLGIEDCENGLVLRPDLARLFAPHVDGAVFSYVATIKLRSGRLWGVEVWRRDGVTGLGIGWPALRKDLGLMPGDAAVFARAGPAADSTLFLARFYDADGKERRDLNPHGPAFPDWLRTRAPGCIAGGGGGCTKANHHAVATTRHGSSGPATPAAFHGRRVRLGLVTLVRHSPGAFKQRLGIEDCENGLVLRPDLSRLLAPHDRPVFSYVATIKLHSGRLWGVEVWRGDGVTGLGIGWPVLRKDLGLKPGDVAVFARGMPAGDSKFFLARFYDADGNERVDRKLHPLGPSFRDWWRAQTGAAGSGRTVNSHYRCSGSLTPMASQGDLTAKAIREAMDLVVQCGAREGSNEHYMATKLFVYAENRAMFLTFKTNEGRFNWLKRCYQDAGK